MKVAVYAIAKNEAGFVERFLRSVKDADEVVVLDTGSSDGTAALLEAGGARVHRGHFSRWRFDDARNASLALVSPDVDVAICLDLDEVVVPGWRAELERVWVEHPTTTRLRYLYTWSWANDGTPGLQYMADKIHVRQGYRWRLPCHEVLEYEGQEVQSFTTALHVLHFPDASKSRSNYLPLLEIAQRENPHDDRTMHYYARELMYAGQLAPAAQRFKEHLEMPTARWDAERAQSMIYLATCEPERAVYWSRRAVAESPDQRETWFHLAKVLRRHGDRLGALQAAQEAERRPRGALVYLSDPEAQGDGPGRLIAELQQELETTEQEVTHEQLA